MYSHISDKFCLENFNHKVSNLFKLRTLPKARGNKMYLAALFYEDKGKREPNFAIVFNLRSFKSDKAIFPHNDSNRILVLQFLL